MQFSNLALMRTSRKKLAPHWGIGILMALVYAVVIGVPSAFVPIGSEITSFLLTGPFVLGLAYFSFSIHRDESPHFFQIFDGFPSFIKSFLAFICQSICIIAGVVFLIIPGIYIGLGLSMTFYVMADRPELSFSECLHESWKMTDGFRFKILGLQLRFILWYIVGFLCLGVGTLVVMPWHYVTHAALYEKIKQARVH